MPDWKVQTPTSGIRLGDLAKSAATGAKVYCWQVSKIITISGGAGAWTVANDLAMTFTLTARSTFSMTTCWNMTSADAVAAPTSATGTTLISSSEAPKALATIHTTAGAQASMTQNTASTQNGGTVTIEPILDLAGGDRSVTVNCSVVVVVGENTEDDCMIPMG